MAIQNSVIPQKLTHEQMQSLIATSTGTIDAYVIPVYGDAPMLLPQNTILSAMSVPAGLHEIEWHDIQLPALSIHHPGLQDVTALVISGETEQQHFALLCDEMPTTLRLRISAVVDSDKPSTALVYQYVMVAGKEYQIPNIPNIQNKLSN